jgi:hypothetical protein
VLLTRQRQLEARHDRLERHCMGCCASHERRVECRSLDCPHLFSRLKLERQCQASAEHSRRVLQHGGLGER